MRHRVVGRSDPSSLRQVHWGFITQGLNAGTNFALSFFVVRAVSADTFGVFALLVVLYVQVIGLLRVTGNHVLTISSAADPQRLRARGGDNAAYAAGLGVVSGVLCLVLTPLVDGELRLVLVILGVTFPFLLVQDALRGSFLAQRRPRLAVVSDGLWAAVQTAGCAVVILGADEYPLVGFVLAWAVGGVVAGVWSLFVERLPPAVHSPLRWLREHRTLTLPLAGNHFLATLPAHLTLALMAVVSDLFEVGVVRAAYLLFGPLATAFAAVYTLALTDASRVGGDQRAIRSLTVKVSVVLGLVGTVWGVAAILLPDTVGHMLLGEIWDHTSGSRVLLAISLVAEGVLVGANVALSALGLPARMARVQLFTAPVTLLGATGLSVPFGAAGAAAGLAIGYWLSALLAWWRVPRNADALPAGRRGSGRRG